MQREGINPDDAQMSDFLCDFCHAQWADDRPMVEGHRGSLICSRCLSLSFDELWNRLGGEPLPEREVCTLCMANHGDPVWVSPAYPEAKVCKRCSKQSVVMLERDPDYGYKRPAPPA